MSVLCVLLIASFSFAQTQQGYVKTKGQLGTDNKVIHGSRLSGATIIVRGGNTVVSANDGSFTLALPENKYYLQDVRKKGYVLNDMDMLSKQYVRSTNPLIIVLESPDKQADNKLAAERKIRRSLQRLLNQKEDEIEELKQQNRLTEEQYRTRLDRLYSEINDDEALIREMAERYARLDYDQMDDFHRELSVLILNGELTRADSLINTKGDVKAQVAEQRVRRKALDAQKEELSRAESVYRQDVQDLAQRCYGKYEIFSLQHQYDSAATYIDLRAGLDSVCIDWQFEAAVFHAKMNHFDKSEAYYQRVIHYLESGNTHDNAPILCVALNNLGMLYNQFHRVETSEQTYMRALGICRQLKDSDTSYEPLYAQTLNNLAILKFSLGLYKESETMFSEVLTIREKWSGENEMIGLPLLAQTLNNLGNLYFQTQRTSLSESLYLRALTVYRKLLEEGCTSFEADQASTLANLGALYQHIGQIPVCKSKYREALGIFSHLAKESPVLYESSLQMVVERLQALMSEKNERNYVEKLEIYRILAKDSPQNYTPLVAQMLNTLADFYDNNHQLDKSEPLYVESMDMYRQLASQDAATYAPYLARALGNLSFHFLLMKEFEKAEGYAREALSTDGNKVFVYANLAHSLLFQGRYNEATTIYDKYKRELKKMFLDDFRKFKEYQVIPDEHRSVTEQIIAKLNDRE